MASFDVGIVGSSLAGASAAIELSRAGLRVALIDKAAFPRRKPCGEGMSAYGLKQLRYLGLTERLQTIPQVAFDGYRIVSRGKSSMVASPWNGNSSIQRTILDAELLELALRSDGVIPFLSDRVTEVQDGRIKVGASWITAKRTILACGGASALLDKLPLDVRRVGPSRVATTATFSGNFACPLHVITIILIDGLEVCCTPLPLGRLNITVLRKSEESTKRSNRFLPDRILKRAFDECGFSGHLELPPQGRTAVGNVTRRLESSTIRLAGDALEEFDPIGGLGMSHALCSGIWTARTTIADLRADSHIEPGCGYTSAIRLPREIEAMRSFTKITFTTMSGANRFPILLPLAGSSVSRGILKFLTRELGR